MDESIPKVSSSQRSLSQSDPKTNCWMSSAVARSVPYNALCAMCSGELCPGASGDKDSHRSLGLPCKPCLITLHTGFAAVTTEVTVSPRSPGTLSRTGWLGAHIKAPCAFLV